MVKNYLPNIPITIPGSSFTPLTQDPLKLNVHSKKNLHRPTYSNKTTTKHQPTTISKNYMKNYVTYKSDNWEQ